MSTTDNGGDGTKRNGALLGILAIVAVLGAIYLIEFRVGDEGAGFGDPSSTELATPGGDPVPDSTVSSEATPGGDPVPDKVVGHVTDAGSGDGVEGATVSISVSGQSATTNADGYYEISGISIHTYSVCVVPPSDPPYKSPACRAFSGSHNAGTGTVDFELSN